MRLIYFLQGLAITVSHQKVN